MSRFEEDVLSVGDSLKRWYSERGSREFTGVLDLERLQPPPRSIPTKVCGRLGCNEPAKQTKDGPRCWSHWPAVVG